MKTRQVLLSVLFALCSCMGVSAQEHVALPPDAPKLPVQFNGGLFEPTAELKLFVCKSPVGVSETSNPLKPGCSIMIDDVFYDHIAFLVMTKDDVDEYASLRSIQMVMTDGSETYMQFSREHKFEFSGAANVSDLRNPRFTLE